MDIVDQILKEIPSLIPHYKESFKDYFDEGDSINISSKLGILNMAFRWHAKDINFEASHIKKMLEMLEEFAEKANEDDLGQLEVRFFEGLSWWAEDKESEPAKRYGDYFLSCIGPKCRELVKRNEAFWKIVNKNKQDRIDKHYAELQKDYDERMALKNK